MKKEEDKIFVIFNTTSIGDVLVTNNLVQNIKYYYPDSYIVFVCNTPIYDVAKYQYGVDEVVTYDKKRCKNLWGILSFALKFPYKKPFASLVTYANERNLIIARLIGSKHIISHNKFKLWNTKEKYELGNYTHMKDVWGGMIEPLTGEHQNFAIKYLPPDVESTIIQKVRSLKNPVPISTTSNFAPKDMKVEDCIELINLLNKNGFTPVLTGAGEVAVRFSQDLRKAGCYEFVDIVGCTSLIEISKVLKICKCCISVDTGTMHLANALQIPVVGIFYDGHMEQWGSDSTLYPVRLLEGKDITPSDIMREFHELVGVTV